MILPVTLVIAAAAALINIWLAVRVTGVRRAHGIWLGDGGNQAVVARTRAHTNFVEYAPFVLILMALIELASGASLWLWGVGVLFIVARLSHGLGMDPGAKHWMRMFGAMSTLLMLLILSVWALVIGYQAAASRPVERTMTFASPKG